MNLSIKYRPTKFEDVCFQENIIKILNQQIQTKCYKNCYLFSGPSGTGKTTVARILQLSINQYTDEAGNLCSSEPIEIDAASNNGVDNVRLITENATARSLDGKYKIFILDEAHMLTSQSWNALLKTIEETPPYTIFIFCTTEYHKIPKTIQNRCQQYFFSRVPENNIIDRLEYICKNEGFTYTIEGLDLIQRRADGSVRQAIQFLEQCSDYSKNIDYKNVISTLGDLGYDTYFNMMNQLIDRDQANIISIVEKMYQEGKDLNVFLEMFIDFVLDVFKFSLAKKYDIIKIPTIYQQELNNVVNVETASKYYSYVLDKLLAIKQMQKTSSQVKDVLEISLLQV